MSLPTPESLLPGLAAVEHALALLEAQLAANTFSAASADAAVTATANGMVQMAALDIASGQLGLGATTLARKVLLACDQALAAAAADSAPRAAPGAAGYNLPGIPGASAPPLADNGFDRVVGSIAAAEPAIVDAIRRRRYRGVDGPVTAEVDGALGLRALVYAEPLPDDAVTLALATVAAINDALFRAKDLFEDTASVIVDDPTARPRFADVRPRALLVVENAASLRASDEKLRARLAALGLNVDVGKAPSVVTADGNGRALVVISESVNPSDVGTKFTSSAVPMVVCEPVSFRDLKMTGGTWGTDKGDATNQTQLQITAGHPLAAGLSGQVTVAGAASKFVWGNPAAAARKVAAITGSSNKWGIFAYDTGEAMVGQNAPARRVGFFAGQDTPAALNDNGWRLFDAAVRWATAAKALLTVKTATPLSAGDEALKRRLEDRHGLEVLLRLEGDSKTSDLADMRVHVISESISSTVVAARYLTSPAPTVILEPNLYDDMKLTGAVTNTDLGEIDGSTEIDVLPGHAMAAGLGGRVTPVSSPQRFGWGKPGAEAVKVANIAGRTDAFAIFAYEGGANMVGTRASAPRVGFFAEGNAPAAFTPDGAALFDAAVAWARGPRALFIVKQVPLRADDDALRKRLEDSFGFVVDVKLATDAVAAHANGHQVVVISESIASGDVGNKFTSVAVPLVSLEPSLFDDLKMTGTTSNTDFGAVNDQTELDLVNANHPLAAGLAAGRVAVVTAAARFVWGLPGSGAVKIARLADRPSAWGVFGYEAGATMVGQAAPARRVGCFVGENAAPLLNEAGRRLFDAAVLWAAGRIEARPGAIDLPDVVRGAPPDTGTPLPPAPPRPAWAVGVAYQVGAEVTHLGLDYRCRQAHTSQGDWAPPAKFALWERINAGSAWTVQVIYQVGDRVTHGGHSYRCLQRHQAQPDWSPPAAPTLWQRL
jgi:DNA-binding protein YbaB